MNWCNILTVYLKELKDSLRDRRALISIIVIPTVVMPLLIFGVGRVASGVVTKARQEIPRVMVLGGEDSPEVLAQLRAAKRLRLVDLAPDWRQQIADKKIRAVVAIPAGFGAGLQAGAAEAVTIYHYEGELKSGLAVTELERFFRDLRESTVKDRLAEHALPARLVRPFDWRRENVAPPEKVGGNLLGGLVPYLIILLCFTGAMYPAMDLTAGEKERGTMETLLCCPVPRVDLVLGKFLMVLTGSLAAMLLALLSMGVSALAAGLLLAGSSGGATKVMAAAGAESVGAPLPLIDPFGLLGVLAMTLPVAVLFSAVIFTVSLFAKTYKEAQSYIGPMIFIVLLPAVVGMLPGMELDFPLALVPVLNLSLVCKEMLSGVWHWPLIGLIFASSSVYAGIALWLAVKMFSRESVMFRT